MTSMKLLQQLNPSRVCNGPIYLREGEKLSKAPQGLKDMFGHVYLGEETSHLCSLVPPKLNAPKEASGPLFPLRVFVISFWNSSNALKA